MARAPKSKHSAAKKVPASSKKGTAPGKKAQRKTTPRKAATAKRAGKGPAAKAPRGGAKKGKPRTASTASHKGATRPARKSPASSPKRAGRAQATKQAQAASGGEGGATDAPGAIGGRVVVQNVNVPGYTTTVDAAKYGAMRAALLQVVPASGGLTQAEMFDAVKPRLPDALFPGGAKSEWWTKCVQLDLEAKKLLVRDGGKPLRWTTTPRQ